MPQWVGSAIKRGLLIFLAPFLFNLMGCATVKYVKQGEPNWSLKPSYVDYYDYYGLYLIGSNTVNLSTACGENMSLSQFRRLISVEDVLLGIITLGVYTPMTVEFWCETNK